MDNLIINDSKKFVFIHIPKCAGTLVRYYLSQYDTTGGKFAVTEGQHPKIGRIDMAHIPLQTLKYYYPDDFEKVQSYQSTAIVRDPFQRFSSSLYQHLKMYGQGEPSNFSARELEQASYEALDYLGKYLDGSLLPYDLIHFQPQHCYIMADDKRVVKHIFEIGDIAKLFAVAGKQLGEVVGDGENSATRNDGKAVFYRSTLAHAVDHGLSSNIRSLLAQILPKPFKTAAKRLLFVEKDVRFRKVMDSQRVIDFIEEYYAEDILLHRAIQKVENF